MTPEPALPPSPRKKGQKGRWACALGASALVVFACGRDTIVLEGPRTFALEAGAFDVGVPPASEAGAERDGGAACRTDRDCGGGAVCLADAGRCVECAADGDCDSPSAPRCDPVAHECVECFTSDDCVLSSVFGNSVCDPVQHRCGFGCTSDASCGGPIPICDLARGVCVQCRTDVDCVAGSIGPFPVFGPLCSVGRCVQCGSDADCPVDSPFCSSRGSRCVECRRSDDCDPGFSCDGFEQRCRPAQTSGP